MGRGRVDALKAVITPLFPNFDLVGTDFFIPNDPSGVISPGDDLEIMLILLNHENWGTATNVSAVLTVGSTEISIINLQMNFEDAWPGMPIVNDSNPFQVVLASSIQPGEYEFILNLISNKIDYVRYQSEFNFILVVEEDNQEVMPGDVNMDSTVNILDIIQIVNIVLDT